MKRGTHPDYAKFARILRQGIEKKDLSLIQQAKSAGANLEISLEDAFIDRDLNLITLFLQAGVVVRNQNPVLLYHATLAALQSSSIAKILLNFQPVLPLNEKLLEEIGMDIDARELQLVVAQRNKAKSYRILPTILSGEEVEQYANLLLGASAKQIPLVETLCVKFVDHWSCFHIKIEKDKIDAIILDSMGKPFYASMIDPIKRAFPKHQIELYYDITRRQSDLHSCSMFVLYDTTDLQKLEKYLPPQYHGDIFEYCKKNTVKSQMKDDIKHHEIKLPLRMMRSMQSGSLLETVIPKRTDAEQNQVINKKGHTTVESVKQKFILFSQGHKRNMRIQDKFIKNLQNSLKFSQVTPPEDLELLLAEYSLPSAVKRLLSPHQ